MTAHIIVNNVSKQYRIYNSHRMRFLELISGGLYQSHSVHWVLRNINLTVMLGESIGIIGKNGSGKSTLLKIITGSTIPNQGTIQVNGRIAAILELGMGFAHHFTGRENATMGLEILGFSKSIIRKLLPKINDFAELGKYFDQPLRTYSSGMHSRLAFSVASAVRPDILIVDEVLSVGDAYFQEKSMKLIESYQCQGTTLLFVSHDLGAVKAFCTRAILLKDGIVIKEGKPEVVLKNYLSQN